jgi:endo-1,4-beta-xylanase
MLRTASLVIMVVVGTIVIAAQTPAPEATWLDADRSEPAGTTYQTFRSDKAGGEVSYLLYLPPGYETAVTTRYPVVYWLHGLGGSQRSGAAFVRHLDAAIRSGKSPAMIAVLVNGLRDSRWVDSYDGQRPVETVFIRELIPHVDRVSRTTASRNGRMIEGFSMGGFGAARIGFKYPDLFSAVSIMAGALLDDASIATTRPDLFTKNFGAHTAFFHANSPWVVVEQNAAAIRGRTAVRIAVGDQDSLLVRNRNYHELLGRLKIDHEYTVVPGVGHDSARLYEKLGEDSFAFYERRR